MAEWWEDSSPNPHWSKVLFKHNNIPISAVAKAMHLSYSYVSNMLCGVVNVTADNEAKLFRLAEGLAGPSDSAPPAEDGEEQ